MEKSGKEPTAKMAISRKKIGGEVPLVVNEITDRCLYTGFFGTLDSARMKSITDKVLEMLSATGIEMVVIDLANVDIVDSAVASHLVRLGDTLKLVGVETIFCGIMPPVAQVMITAGIEMKGFRITRDLKSAIRLVFEMQGIKLVRIEPGVE
jgi:rsbT co-antagonist protein RsbR